MTTSETFGEDAEVVAAAWSVVLSYGSDRIDPIVSRTAHSHPSLRVLWPMVSHGVLYLSRCTQYPWSRDVGTAFPQSVGGYRVRRESDRTLIGVTATVEEAYELIAANLPDNCGPAVVGTADNL
ncbi:DUF6193 family natural product biosynthesis protein [Streptomyces pratensis]|uniref:DUF6193 family natural product biosynthesis protein n=1 Tax=Streptomyces pratensis TaxID=1169025 RepID=UPI0036315A8A